MDTKEFKGVIEDIVDARISKKGITKFVSAVVKTVNSDGSVDVYLPPDTEKIVSGVLNKTGERLSVGDSVELCTKNGKTSNAWVSVKHGTNFNVDKEITDLKYGVIVDMFESASGMYIKYSNGLMIQTKRVYDEIAFKVWYGDISYFDTDMGNWLIPFKDNRPIVLIGDSFYTPQGSNQLWPCQSPNNITTTHAGIFRSLRVSDVGATSIIWKGHAVRTCIGFWK